MTQPNAFAAVRAASAFARRAWRRVGLIQLVAACGLALWVAGLRAPPSPEADQACAVGLAIALVAAAPLSTGLIGAALGRRVAVGGLQFGAAEARLLALAASGLAALFLGFLVLIGVSAGAILLFNLLGPVDLPRLGPQPGGLVAGALVWLFGLCALAWGAGRLAFAPVMSLVEDRLVIEEAWGASRGRAGAALATLVLAHGPTLLALSLAALVDSLTGQPPFAASGSWPVAIAAGAVFGVVVAFVQAPLAAGALVALHAGRCDAAFAAATQSDATLQPA